MKKFKKLIVLIAVLVMATASFASYASDAADLYFNALMNSDDEHIFFGEVASYNADGETRDIEITPVKSIKGSVEEGRAQVFHRPLAMGGFDIKTGETYLVIYYESSDSVDMFDVTTYNTKTLKIKHVDEELWKMFETYLNDGKFGHAKIGTAYPVVMIVAGLVMIAVGIAMVVVNKKKK